MQNEDLAGALRFAQSVPGRANTRRASAADRGRKAVRPSHAAWTVSPIVCGGIALYRQSGYPRSNWRFCDVPRERFVGPGPWRIRSPMHMDGYWSTEDADPRHVYHDVLIALDEARGINNGQPGLWARLFDHLDIKTWGAGAASGLRHRLLQRNRRRTCRAGGPGYRRRNRRDTRREGASRALRHGRRSGSATRTALTSPLTRPTSSLPAPARPIRCHRGSTHSNPAGGCCFR